MKIRIRSKSICYSISSQCDLKKSNDGVSTAGGRARYVDSLVIAREKKSVGRIGNQERGISYLSQCLIERERKSTRPPVILRKTSFRPI